MSVNRKKKVTRITPLNSEEMALSQPRISEFLSDNANKESTRPSAPSSPDAEKTSNLSPQVEKVPLLKESVSEAEGTAKVAWSVVKPNTTSTLPVELQNPSNSSDVACRSEVKRGKNYEKNRKRREKKRVMRGLAGMTLADHDPESSDHSCGQTKRARESSDSLSSSTNLPQKRERHDVVHDMQGGKAKKTMVGTSTPASYAAAVKASNQKLTITRKESEGDGGMDSMDLREVQSAITKMILRTDPGFLIRIERTFIFEGKVLMICKDEKTLEWAKQVIEAIVPSLVVHQGYDAKGPKDLPPAKTFGIWLPEDEGLNIFDTLTLVSRCNAKISRRDSETKHSAKGNGGMLHVVSVREPSLTTLKELNYNPYAGYRRIQFQKKKSAKQLQNLETSSRLPKGDETCETIMDTAERGTSADTEKPTTSSS